MTKEYIAYRGEQPLGTGTIEELADKLGYTYRNMRAKSHPSIRKRIKDVNNAILLYEIEDDEDDNQIKPIGEKKWSKPCQRAKRRII